MLKNKTLIFEKEWFEQWFKYIIMHPEHPWIWNRLSRNPNIIAHFLPGYYSLTIPIYVNRYNVHANPEMTTWKQVYDNCDHPWDWGALSTNPNITMDIVLEYRDLPWCWDEFSTNTSLSWPQIIKKCFYPWNWKNIKRNTSLMWELFQPTTTPQQTLNTFNTFLFYGMIYLFLTWFVTGSFNWKKLSSHPKLTWKYINHPKNKKRPWNWITISSHPNITWEIINANPNCPWNWIGVSSNPNITWNLVQANPEYPWNYDYLSKNKNITWDIIMQNKEKAWNWQGISENPNISWEIIDANLDKPWNWWKLNNNDMSKTKQFYIECRLRQYMQTWFQTSDVKKEMMETLFHPKNINKFKDWGFE